MLLYTGFRPGPDRHDPVHLFSLARQYLAGAGQSALQPDRRVVAIALTGGGLSLGAMVGLVTVFGVSARNAILLLAHYEHLVEEEGAPWNVDTILRGAQERLVPILMTAAVTALGLMPLAIGMNQPGQEIEGPMAVTVLGGLISSTLLNLVVLPALAERFGGPEREEARHDARGCCFLLAAALLARLRQTTPPPALAAGRYAGRFRPDRRRPARRSGRPRTGGQGFGDPQLAGADRTRPRPTISISPGRGAAAPGRCAGAPGRRGAAAERGR